MTLKTFDLLLFSGREPLSFLIESSELLVLGNGSWSHVGVVLEGKYLQGLLPSKRFDPDHLYVWESTISLGTPDIVTGKCHDGVQIRDLQGVLGTYSGKVAAARLNRKLPEGLIRETVRKIYRKYEKYRYIRNPLVLITALCCCLRCVQPAHFSGIFCSEFVGEIYRELHIIQDDIDPKDIVPVDFLGVDRDGMKVVVDTNLVDLK